MNRLKVVMLTLLISLSIPSYSHHFYDGTIPLPKYEYVELTMNISVVLGRNNLVFIVHGNQDRNSSGRQRERLKDNRGNDLRFESTAGVIEYMEHEHGYELLHLFTSGESANRIHLVMRRPISRG